jgi:hypothetical protein
MRIYLITHAGRGFAGNVEVPTGTTLGQTFVRTLPQADPCQYLMRLNRRSACGGTVLCPGCRVTFTPSNIASTNRALGSPQ